MSSLYLKSSFTFLLIYTFLNLPVFSQCQKLPSLEKIDEDVGLSNKNVQCIYKDHHGFMWVGTKSGLNLIDGSTISIFKNNPGDKNSIFNNIINCIASDSNELLWVGTQHGLNSFDPT